jgi:hypothetical protein
MTTDTDAVPLLPCPFCGAGATSIKENGKIWMGSRYSEPCSVSVIHWCPPIDGQPSRQIERIGRDEESAIAEWNRRAPIEVQADHIADELREAARQFHNLTQGDPTVIIRPPSAEKRDTIMAAGERLRAALAASSAGNQETGS